jgi:hypothetical protein
MEVEFFFSVDSSFWVIWMTHMLSPWHTQPHLLPLPSSKVCISLLWHFQIQLILLWHWSTDCCQLHHPHTQRGGEFGMSISPSLQCHSIGEAMHNSHGWHWNNNDCLRQKQYDQRDDIPCPIYTTNRDGQPGHWMTCRFGGWNVMTISGITQNGLTPLFDN